jgi:predicted AlkP superfamily pyrophosphatase or phosphodiesterase
MRRWPCRSPCPAWGLALFVSAACVEGPAKAPPLAQATQGTTLASAPARSSKHVLVTIVVDQLAGWIADERWPELPKDGGFARLRREGTWVKQMRYAHAVTDTAPGHSSLYTAVPPRESGIFANELPDGKGGRLSFLRDESAHLVAYDGQQSSPAASLAKLRVDTLADVLHREDPGAVVLSFSLKDRGALFGAGRSPRAALWFDPKSNRVVTSSAIARTFPSWALPLASGVGLSDESRTWDLLDAPWVRAHAKTPDDQPGEGDERGFGRVFPHPLTTKEPGYALRTSPFGDELLFALALAGIDGEKVVGHDALVALSLSSNDYIGHVFGPDSWEAWDEIARLDRELARFLDGLDARFGKDGYAVLLTADHGVTTMPEAALVPGVRGWCDGARGAAPDPWERACGSVGRLFNDALEGELRAATEKALGPGAWVFGVVDPYVYLTPAGLALDGPKRDLLDLAIGRALRAHPEVDQVTPKRSLPRECPPESDESIAALVCRSVSSDAGDYYVVPSRGSFFDPNVVVGKGTSHGSPYLFDRAVPLLARAPGRIAAGTVVTTPVGFETFARTAAALLGIDAPGHAQRGANLVTE